MLISDAAGMGKTTLLTYLSKEIKKEFPQNWVVRLDLNDHTDILESQKGKKMNEERAIELISNKMLKLDSPLEKELFKVYFEQKKERKIVLMLDGFDEISPSYNETVIDLLQALKQTLAEVWVTTRPHLRNELEDNIQQLAYILEPFSQANQIDFLTRFWRLQ